MRGGLVVTHLSLAILYFFVVTQKPRSRSIVEGFWASASVENRVSRSSCFA